MWEITGAEFTNQGVHTADGISIRFPRVTRIRHDKNWSTATTLNELRELFRKKPESVDFSLLLGGDTGEPPSDLSADSDKVKKEEEKKEEERGWLDDDEPSTSFADRKRKVKAEPPDVLAESCGVPLDDSREEGTSGAEADVRLPRKRTKAESDRAAKQQARDKKREGIACRVNRTPAEEMDAEEAPSRETNVSSGTEEDAVRSDYEALYSGRRETSSIARLSFSQVASGAAALLRNVRASLAPGFDVSGRRDAHTMLRTYPLASLLSFLLFFIFLRANAIIRAATLT